MVLQGPTTLLTASDTKGRDRDEDRDMAECVHFLRCNIIPIPNRRYISCHCQNQHSSSTIAITIRDDYNRVMRDIRDVRCCWRYTRCVWMERSILYLVYSGSGRIYSSMCTLITLISLIYPQGILYFKQIIIYWRLQILLFLFFFLGCCLFFHFISISISSQCLSAIWCMPTIWVCFGSAGSFICLLA